MKLRYLIPVIIAFPLMGAACDPIKPQDLCTDRPVFEPYKIDVPVRPVLQSDKQPLTDTPEGTAVRSSVLDTLLLQEYAEKLENIVKSLPKSLSVPKQ